MRRRDFLKGCAATGAMLLVAPAAFAQEEVVSGEVWVTLKGTDYAKPYFEGAEYEDHEFEKNGTKLVIRVEDYSRPLTFELRPSMSEFAPVEITTVPKKFKATRVRGSKARRRVFKTKVTFKKKEPAKK